MEEKDSGREKKELVVIVGPTAVGKTRLSLDLADRFKGEIISADSMQIYRGMDIGTAKVSKDEMRGIPHHLLDFVDPQQEFSVADYQELAEKKIKEIQAREKIPFMVGGTGLYIRAVLKGFVFPPMDIDYDWRQKKAEEAEKFGSEKLHHELERIDPELAKKIHPNDIKRIIRGLEVYYQTGKKASYFRQLAKNRGEKYRTLKIGLERDRDELYERIEIRVDRMLEGGLVEEVKKLMAQGCHEGMTSMQGLGYKEILGYLKGEYSLEKARYLLKRNTRHYAKRQLTWFKKDPDIHWYNLSQHDYQEVLNQISQKIRLNF